MKKNLGKIWMNAEKWCIKGKKDKKKESENEEWMWEWKLKISN